MSDQVTEVRQHVAKSRLIKLRRLVKEKETWRDCLLDIQTDLERQRKTLEDNIAKNPHDIWDVLPRQLDEVKDLLDAVVRGNDSSNFAGLTAMVIERGLAPLPGERHPLGGRFGLKRTRQQILELHNEIEECEETLQR